MSLLRNSLFSLRNASPLFRNWLALAGRLALAAAVVAWLGHRYDIGTLVRRAASLPPRSAVLSIACLLASVAFGALRWRMLLGASGMGGVTVLSAVRTTLEAGFLNLLPTGLAGDAMRAVRVRREVGGARASLSLLVVDRVAGLLGLMSVAALAALARVTLGAPLTLADTIAMGAGAFVAAATIAVVALERARRLPVMAAPLVRGRVARLLALSLGSQAWFSLAMALVVQAFSPSISLVALLGVAPIAILGTFLPLTPAGVGQRELVFAAGFGLVGVDAESAISAAIAWLGVGLFVAALGAISLVRGQRAQ